MSNPDKDSYVTPDLLSELDDILEEEKAEKELFDDFSKDLSETAPSNVTPESNTDVTMGREEYLKERRKNPNLALPDSVEP